MKQRGSLSKKNIEKLRVFFNSIGIKTDVDIKSNNKATRERSK